MAIAYDNATYQGVTSGSTINFSHTCTGSDLGLVVVLSVSGNDVTGVTYNGVSMTQVGSVQFGATGTYQYAFALSNPATGSHTVSMSSTASRTWRATASSYTGVNQTTASLTEGFNSVNETASGNRTVSVTVSTANSWLVASHYSNDADPTSAVNGVNRVTFGEADLVDSNGTVGTGSQTIGYGWGTSDNHVIIGFAITPKASTATAFPKLSLLGVGK